MKRTVFILMVFLAVLLAGSIRYVAFTEQGLRWVFAQAKNAVPGELSVRDVNGRLIGPISLNGITYRSEEYTVSVDSLSLDWRPSRLLLLRAHIKEVNAFVIRIKTKETHKSVQPGDGLPDITLPLRVILEKVQIRDISVSRLDTEPPIIIEDLLLTDLFGRKSIQIGGLNARTPDFSLALQGRIKPQGDYPLNVQIEWHIRPEGYPEITGRGELAGTLKQLVIKQQTLDPFVSRVQATVYDLLHELRWEASLSLSDLSLHKVNSAWPEMEITAQAESRGSVSSFDVDGTVDIVEDNYGKFSGALSLSNESNTWLVRMVKLTVPGTDAEVQMSGRYTRFGDASSMQLKGRWNALSWPIRGKDSVVKSEEGTFDITGAPDSFTFILNAAVTGRDIPQSSIAVRGTGTQSGVEILSLSGQMLEGELSGTASVGWKPSLVWRASLQAESINPGARWPDWPGNIRMKADATGEDKDGKQRVSLENALVQGELRGYPFKVSTAFEMEDDSYRVPRFELSSGSAYLTASGSYSYELEGEWNVDIPKLGELLPGGGGELSGNGNFTGNAGLPNITAMIRGKGVSLRTFGAKNISADININHSMDAYSGFNITAENVFVNSYNLKTVSFKGDGTVSSHTILLDAEGEDGSLSLRADAGYEDKVWKGDTLHGELKPSGFGSWKMREEGTFSVSSGKTEIGNWCLLQDPASLCLQASWDKTRGFSGTAEASDIPLALFKRYMPKDVDIEGIMGGSAEVSYDNTRISGRLDLEVPDGILSYSEDKGEPLKFPLSNAAFHGRITDSGLYTDMDITFPGRGFVKGSIALPGVDVFSIKGESQAVSGEIVSELKSLDMIPVFTERVRNINGIIRADLKVAGTSLKPVIYGDIDADQVSAYIPDLGIKVSDIKLKLTGTQKGDADFYGQASSGDGKITFRGTFATASGGYLPAHLHVEGDRFEVIKTPGAWILVSPDIRVRIEERNIFVEGKLSIPEASLEPPDRSGAVAVSKDVFIISESPEETAADQWKINSRIELKLGEKIRFKGYGLSCRIAGGVTMAEEPGKATTAHGELEIVEGLYKAYGQDLAIEKGRLLFVGLVDDPGLDVRAVRHIKDIVSGVQVRGTLKVPEMSVFSVPSMDQSDALSYLLFGRPMNRLAGSEGEQLYTAAASAGLRGGGLIAKKIGAAFGLEDVEIEGGATMQEAALFVGKYLSPRLYMSYGIGLFEPVNTVRLRYLLSTKWLLQTEYGTESGGDLLYKIER